jgi:hypothetical protein
MCGYCIEYNAFVMIASVQSGSEQFADLYPQYLWAMGYLQDCPDIHATLAATSTDVATAGIIPTIIACRGMETLITQGFTSDAYQMHLKTPAYVAAIETFTEEAGQINHRPQDPRFDLSAFGWTEDRRTYIEPGYLEEQLQQWSLQDAKSLHKQYVDFRLKGIGLHRNDLNERFKQTGVLDPIEDICDEDRHALVAHFPAFWGALLWLGRHPDGMPYLWEVVTNDPIGVPYFYGLELWIQRQAALQTYDRFGIAPFLKDIASVRGDLFQFIGLLRPVSGEDKSSLLTALNQLEIDDIVGTDFSLRRWLEKGDLQVS